MVPFMNIRSKNKLKWLKIVGFVLFLLSLFPGYMLFYFTPYSALKCFDYFAQYGGWQNLALCAALLIGWLANFTVFFRSPALVAIFAIVSPWVLYLGEMFFDFGHGVKVPWPNTLFVGCYPFYPWAVGIALIHISRLMEPKPIDVPRSPWTGF